MNAQKSGIGTLVLVVCLVVSGPALVRLSADPVNPNDPATQSTVPPFSQLAMGASPDEIRTQLGPPAFAEDSILMYATEALTPQGPVAADLTLWFSSGELFFASYALPVDGLTETDLASQFDAISQTLRAEFGEPSSRASTPGSFTTEVWNLDDINIEHTIILDAGRTDHVVTITSASG